jgi:hypothetical protein
MYNTKLNTSEFGKLHTIPDNLLNIIFTQSKELSLTHVLDKICVSNPYFSFKKIYQYENILIAKIDTEQPINDELSLLSIGEAGRHMAILGTCACAIDAKEKYFYLVKEAKITLKTRNIEALSRSSDLYIAIEPKYINNKIANSTGILFNDKQETIYTLDVSYNKVKTAVFKKIFSKEYCEVQPIFHNPYSDTITLKEIETNSRQIVLEIPEIPAGRCAGHFKGYPILPTAFMIYNILHCVGQFILNREGGKRYYISAVYLSLLELLFLKSDKKVIIDYHSLANNSYEVVCKIIQDDKKNSQVSFLIACI